MIFVGMSALRTCTQAVHNCVAFETHINSRFTVYFFFKSFLTSFFKIVLNIHKPIDFELKKSPAPPPPLGNFADISYLEDNFKPHLLRDVCTLCSGALVSDSLFNMLL